MRRGLVGLGFGIAVFAMAGQVALAAESLGLITGSDKGTYYQFGLNLQALVKPQGIDLTVYPSRGSVENIYAVFQRPGVQMGIVQADVLAFVSRIQTDPVLKRIAGKTKLIFPLYNEEIHLLGRRDIASFDDLGGQARRHRARRQRHLSHQPAPLQDVGGRAQGDGPDRHRRGARGAEGRAHRRHVLRGGLSRPSS